MEVIEKYNELIAERKILKKQLKEKKLQFKNSKRNIKAHINAINILTETSKIIYKETIEKIESVVTLAIRHVYERRFDFKIILEEKRNNLEARMVVTENGKEFNIKDDQGGGMIDIISFALRIIMWHIKEPRSRNVLILDEPFKWTGLYIEEAGQMLRYLAKKLNMQIILVTHDEKLMGICDKIYYISHNGIESKVKLIKQEKLRRRK